MKIRKNITFIIILILCACKERQKTEQKSEPTVKSETKIKAKSELNDDYSKSAEFFVREILNENIRIHKFNLTSSENPKHLKIFQPEGLEGIIAYSNKNYPKKSKPKYYEHFVLFVATYSNNKTAKNAFSQIKKDSKKYKIFDNLENLDPENYDRIRALMIGVKPGGLITQNGKQVFSLVENCRNTPIGGTWIEYETKFLKFISNNMNKVEVLNSDCGKMASYIIEKRVKASR